MDEDARPAAGHRRWLAVACLAPVAAGPAWLPLLPPGAFWIARLLALAGSALVIAVLTQGREQRALAASPPVVLGLLALLFYSVFPALYAEFALDGPLTIPSGIDSVTFRALPGIPALFAAYTSASPGEAAVLCFAAVLPLVVLWLDSGIPAGAGARARPDVGTGLAVVAVAGLLFQAGKHLLAEAPSPMLSSLVDLLPPVVTLGMALLAVGARQPRERAWALAGFACGAALLFPYQMKTCALLAGMVLFAWTLSLRGAARGFLLAAMVVLPVLATAAAQATRAQEWHSVGGLRAKLVDRQAETGICLNFALREAMGSEAWHDGPLYYAAGLVPRLVWPDKPTLSHGEAYARAFCGITMPALHSSSITLLGEPLLRGGVWGGVAAGLTLVGLHALAFAAWKRGRGLAPAAVLGLSPWMTDFDQDFALYVATIGKFGIAIVAVCLLLRLLRRPPARAP